MYSEETRNHFLELIRNNSSDPSSTKLFNSATFPNSRVGVWKYIKLNDFKLDGISPGAADKENEANLVNSVCEELNISNNNLVIIDNGNLSFHNTVDNINISVSNYKKENCLVNNHRLNHWFTVINQCMPTTVLDINVSEHSNISEILYIVHIASNNGRNNFFTAPQVNLYLGKNSSLKIAELYISNDKSNDDFILQNPKSCYHIREGASCEHTVIHRHGAKSAHIADVNIQQSSNSMYKGNFYSISGCNSRTGINVQLAGDSAKCEFNSLQWPSTGESHDIYLNVDHLYPKTTCDCTSRAVASEGGTASFTGNINVTNDANFSEASLNNNNLLLSPQGKIFSRPELEIDNDDVKCSHGTTIGQLDPEMIFYLQSRGISKKEAQNMLVSSFISPVLSHLSDDSLSAFVKEQLQGKVNESEF